MKIILSLILLITAGSAHATLSLDAKGHLFIAVAEGKKVSVDTINSLLDQNYLKSVKLFKKGEVDLISIVYAKGPEKIAAVREDGFYFIIEPFSGYHVKDIDSKGLVQFKEKGTEKFKIKCGYIIDLATMSDWKTFFKTDSTHCEI